MSAIIQFKTPKGPAKLPLRGDEPTVKIGSFTFRAHFAFELNGRPTIVYTSLKDGESVSELFLAYKSASEGFWRLLLGGSGGYYKGSDYIVSTFLHMELQKMFTDIYSTVPPKIPGFPNPAQQKKAVDNYFDGLEPQIREDFDEKNIFREERDVDEPIFDILNNLITTQYEYIMPRNAPQGGREYVRGRNDVFFLKNEPLFEYYKWLKSPLLSNKNMNHKKRRHPPPNERYQAIESMIIGEIEKEGSGGKINQQESLALLGRVVSKIFENIDDKLNFEFQTSILYPIDQTNLTKGYGGFDMAIYSKKYKSNMTGKLYNFYIGFYTYNSEKFKHLVFIEPMESDVYQNGCYTKIVKTRMYVYKPIDYFDQCYSALRGANDYCSQQYGFIGHVFQDMWPLSVIDFPPDFRGGGKRRRQQKRGQQKRRMTLRRHTRKRMTRKLKK